MRDWEGPDISTGKRFFLHVQPPLHYVLFSPPKSQRTHQRSSKQKITATWSEQAGLTLVD